MRSAIEKREKDVTLEAAHVQLLQKQQKDIEVHVVDFERRANKKQLCAEALGQEIRQLRAVLSDAADETRRQQRRCHDVVHERDMLDRQVTDRAAEVQALYEQAHTKGFLLRRHEALYNDQAQQLEHLEYRRCSLHSSWRRCARSSPACRSCAYC
ncbi:hypothetical protein NXY56_004253 [Leishmania guyanensis]